MVLVRRRTQGALGGNSSRTLRVVQEVLMAWFSAPFPSCSIFVAARRQCDRASRSTVAKATQFETFVVVFSTFVLMSRMGRFVGNLVPLLGFCATPAQKRPLTTPRPVIRCSAKATRSTIGCGRDLTENWSAADSEMGVGIFPTERALRPNQRATKAAAVPGACGRRTVKTLPRPTSDSALTVP